MTEFEIRDQIVQYLESKGCMVWKDKQPVSKPRKGTMRKSNGVPDILGILRDGTFLGIEVKKPEYGTKISLEQLQFIKEATKRYAVCFVATSLQDVLDYETEHKMELR